MPEDRLPAASWGSEQSGILDDETIEAILRGHQPPEDALGPLVAFAQDVRAVAECPVPRPSPALAEILTEGFSTEKGDLLVTAASNVNGPETQAAGLPKWRKRPNMLPTGILSGLAAKIVAGVVAALAGVTAVGAAGALPGPTQHVVADVINSVTPFNLPDGDTSVAAGANLTTNPTHAPIGGGASVSTGTDVTGDTNVSANVSTGGANVSVGTGTNAGAAGANVNANTTTPSIPNLPNLPGLSNLPNLANLPAVQIPSCVKDIVDLKTGQPKVPLSQISTQVVNCVKTLMATSGAQVPAGVSQCVSSILSMVGTITPGSVPNISGLDFSKCVPVDVTKCMTSVMGMFKNFAPGFGFGGSAGTGGASATGGASIPGISGVDLSGCLPFNLDSCLSSIFGMAGNLPGVALGGVPGLGSGSIPSLSSLDLSSCVPFGAIGNIPGLSQFAGLLPH